jgi:hypothetical protein
MLDLSEAKIREPLRPAPFRQDGAFQEGNAPYRAKRIAAGVVNRMGIWANKPLGEVAVAAAAQNEQAETALKLVKDARRLGQRY